MQAEFVPPHYFRQLTLAEIFPGREPPVSMEVDLGCGDGSFLIAMAQHYPERCFLGVERLKGRVERVGRKIQQAGLQNCRVLRLESAYTVGWLLPTVSVARLHLLCPDPWPKKKHHRRRLVLDEEFNAGLERVLQPEGEFLFKTDDAEYFEVGSTHFDEQSWLQRITWEEADFYYPQTDFERHWLAAGKTLQRARWRKRWDLNPR